ncbi:helix-turn-helix transcriptional regulator [Caproiciproducens galactitolivorans]|uniref:Helix-turn-helix domain protein n=1 Tax=Caproiciproducens galactitolivorans TaxID=642589 RepID=A0A4Z0YEG9_9FIRM|nr:helix-turn-helix transcriptional regulator [Caproiciproducens galactitolivorans]TGJ76146.1 helix-turn-helix domain protein [Caproiciproducens galactitolivorans]
MKEVKSNVITGKEFKEIREYKGLSLRDVAKFCDVSPQLIGQIEQGKKYFTENNYQQIIDAMNLATVAKASGELEKHKGIKLTTNK